MKKLVSKTEAKEKIDLFFKKDNFSSEEVKKIKNLAMKFNIKLGSYRKSFCKKCYSSLHDGKVRTNKEYKTLECSKCKFLNKWKIV